MSLYADLDVEPDADAQTIKRAHRKAARKHHPDAGGDREEFEKIQRAYLVLSDPDRRRRYDETGEDKDSIENPLAEIVECIMPAFDMALQACGGAFEHRDMIAETRRIMEQRKVEIGSKKVEIGAELARIRGMLRRLKFSGDGVDLIGSALRNRIRELERVVPVIEKDIAKFSAAIAYLDHYGFEFEQAPAASFVWTVTS